jgi:hypothetical protein
VLLLAGLGLAAFLAWQGLMSLLTPPQAIIIHGKLVVPNVAVYRLVVAIQYVLIVAIIMALVLAL